ncbi:MAG: DUF3078 domain-containing protein [Flavobacteriaceae bacterium]
MKIYPLLILVLLISWNGSAQEKDTIWLDLKGYKYFSFGKQDGDTIHPRHKKEWCFTLIKPEDKTSSRDSLDISLLKLEGTLTLDNFKYRELDSIKNIEVKGLNDINMYQAQLDSLEQKIALDSLTYLAQEMRFNRLDSLIKKEEQLKPKFCFSEVNRGYQEPLSFPEPHGLNISYNIKISELANERNTAFRNRWKNVNSFTVLINQNAFSNWNAGGENSISTIFRGHFERDYRFEFIIWENDLRFGIGFNQERENAIRKTEDLFEFNSTFGFRTNLISNWYYSANMNFRTQFADGYNYPDTENPISRLMAPAYFMLGVGAGYASKDQNSSLYFSPVTNKTTFVLDQTLANAGSFGVTGAIYDEDGNLLTPGQTKRTEMGILVQGRNQLQIVQNVIMKNELRLYTDYVNNFGNIDVDWNLNVDFIVNRFIKANFGTRFIYDDDIDTFETNDEGIEINEGPKLQIKQLLGLGLIYSF